MTNNITNKALAFNRYLGLDGNAFAQSFSDEQETHGYYFDDDKKERVFGVVGKENVYEIIQSYKSLCDFTFIKEQLLANGSDIIDESLFADVSSLPRDMLSSFEMHQKAVDTFNKLPLEVRYKYNNNPNEFAKKFNISDFVKSSVPTTVKVENKQPVPTTVKVENKEEVINNEK